MTTTYAGADSFPANITEPTDGDVRNAASVKTPLDGLADRTKWLVNRSAPTILQFGFISLSGGASGGYVCPGYGTGLPLTERSIPMPCAGKLKNLRLWTANPATGYQYLVNVYKNGVSTTLAATLYAGGASAYDISHEVTFVAGDRIGVVITFGAGSTHVADLGIAIEVDNNP